MSKTTLISPLIETLEGQGLAKLISSEGEQSDMAMRNNILLACFSMLDSILYELRHGDDE